MDYPCGELMDHGRGGDIVRLPSVDKWHSGSDYAITSPIRLTDADAVYRDHLVMALKGIELETESIIRQMKERESRRLIRFEWPRLGSGKRSDY